MESIAPEQLATLGHPQRIAVFRLLMRRYPDLVPAGELAATLGIKPSTLSAYLAALHQARLITQHRAGTSLRYTIDMIRVQNLFDYLFADCARARPALSILSTAGSTPMADRKFNVLFICTGNSARSIFAESLMQKLGGDRFNVYSAGTQPNSDLNPFALQLLKDKGHDTEPLRAKHISDVTGPDAPPLDFVFTVCNQAANEECPAWDGQPISGHWGMPDPVKATGTDAQKSLAFQHTYGALKRRIEAFTALPVESLDRIALQSAIDEISRTPTEEHI